MRSGGGPATFNSRNPATTDATGYSYGAPYAAGLASRLITHRWLFDNTQEFFELLWDLTLTGQASPINYFLGGVTTSGDATAMHPAVRDAIFNVMTTGPEASAKVRNAISNAHTGACYNHQSASEPQWRNASWGDNYPRLVGIKAALDPDGILNCWHCVGYQGSEYEDPDLRPSLIEAPMVFPEPLAVSNPAWQPATGAEGTGSSAFVLGALLAAAALCTL